MLNDINEFKLFFIVLFHFILQYIGNRMFIHTATALSSNGRFFLSLSCILSLLSPCLCLTSCPRQSNSDQNLSCIVDEGSPSLSTAVEIAPLQLQRPGVETCSHQVTRYG